MDSGVTRITTFATPTSVHTPRRTPESKQAAMPCSFVMTSAITSPYVK